MQEFTIFMPEALGLYRQPPAGLVGIMPHPSAQTPTQPWEAPEAPPVAAAEKVKAPSRRRKRAAEKEQVPPQKATTGRVSPVRVFVPLRLTLPSGQQTSKAQQQTRGLTQILPISPPTIS